MKLLPVELFCGDTLVEKDFCKRLEAGGVTVRRDAKLQLLLDRPAGWAMMNHAGLVYERCIISSDNPCPAYRLELLDRNPAALLPLQAKALLQSLPLVRAGNRILPEVRSVLTRAERQTLTLLALGYHNSDIAARRGVGEATVKNCLVEVYRKLGLTSRVQAVHYFFGNWHLLEGWEPPENT